MDTQREDTLKELALLAIVFVLVVGGIGFGLSSIARNNQASAASAVATAFIDPLNKNVDGRWLESTHCVFRAGTYHVLTTSGGIGLCGLRKLHFSNDAILVDVSLLVGGDAGLLFDINDLHGQMGFYAFFITSQGKFFFCRYTNVGPNGHVSCLNLASSTRALRLGQQRNTLQVDASKDSSFLLAINGVDVGKVQDKQGAFSGGEIGLAVNLTSSALHGDASFSKLVVLPL